jgi:hypothetical protein
VDDEHREASHAPISKAILLMRRWTIQHVQQILDGHAPAWYALKQNMFSDQLMVGCRFVNGLAKRIGDGSERFCILTSDGEPQCVGIFKQHCNGSWTTSLPALA